MKVTHISITAGRKFPHPLDTFASLLQSVTLSADLADGDDVKQCTKNLQAAAEQYVEEGKRRTLSILPKSEKAAQKHAAAQYATEGRAEALATKHGGGTF